MRPPPTKVLVVDDDYEDFIIVRDLLEEVRRGSYHVVHCDSCRSVVDQIESVSPDVILVDFFLGCTDGTELIRELSQHDSSVPVLVLTGSESQEIDELALEAGAVDFLVKDGLTSQSIERSIRYAIDRSRHEQNLANRLKVEEALSRVSQVLITGRQAGLTETLKIIGDTLGADNVAAMIFRPSNRIQVLEEWYAPESIPRGHYAEALDLEQLRWTRDKMVEGHCVPIPDVHMLPEEAAYEKETMIAAGLCGIMMAPIRDDKNLLGMLAITNSERMPSWSEDDIHASHTVGELIGNWLHHEKTREALEESEEKYRALVENAREAIFVVQDEKFVYFNDSLKQLLHAEHDQIINQSIGRFIHPEDLEMVVQRYRARMKGDSPPAEYSFRIINLLNQVRWVELNVVVIDWEARPASLCFIQDVTDRQKADEELHRSREQYRHLYNNALVGLFRTDLDTGRILAANEHVAGMFGYGSLKEFVREFTSLDHYVDSDARSELIRLLDRDGCVEDFQTRFCRKDGSIFWGRFNARIVVEDNCIEGVITDITDQRAVEDQLSESRNRYQELIDSIQEGIGFVDENELIGFCNPAYAKILEVEAPEELIGVSLMDFLSENGKQQVLEQTEGRREGFVSSYELDVITAKGNPRTILATVSPRFDDEGEYTGAFGSILDISARVKAEAALRESEVRLKAILDSVPTGIVIVDAKDHVVIDSNPAALKTLGTDRDELVGSGCRKHICAGCDDEPCPLSGGPIKIENAETFVTRADGTKVPVLKSVVPVTLDGRNHYVESFIDVTEVRRQEKELRKLSSAVNQSPNMILITNSAGVIEYINPHFTEVTGYEADQAIGKTPSILYSGKQSRAFYDELWKTLKAGGTWSGNLQNQRKNGDVYWERKSISPILNRDGKATHYLSVGEDITREILSQRKLAESDKLSAIGMLAAGVSHEFKNYLGGIIGNASFALDQLEQGESVDLAKDTLNHIVELGEKANEVAMSLLSYSKAKPDETSREDLKDIIRRSIQLVEKEMRHLTIEIATYFEDVPPVEVSASKIQQLFLNLLINAQHAIRSDGVITVSLVRSGDKALIKIGDTGMGIPQDKADMIFDPFYSTKGVWGKDEVVGSGMGLSICRNIAQEHGGDITVQSIEGVGTTFVVSLPIKNDDEQLLEIPSADGPSTSILIFSLEKSMVSHYHAHACEINTRLTIVDNVADVDFDVGEPIDLVLCDTNFSGKVELLLMAQKCQKYRIPYVMANCGTMEYQLADLFDNSAGNFAAMPPLERLLEIVNARPAHYEPGH